MPASPQHEQRNAAIFGGTADTGHDGVMALLQWVTATRAYGCTGTTIAKVGSSGILLTAAHCVAAHDEADKLILPLRIVAPSEMRVVWGTDWQVGFSAGQQYQVAEISVPPGYDGMTSSPYDVALLRYLSPLAAVPVIPALTAAEDNLTAGSSISLVGYGRTETDAANSTRRTVEKEIGTLTGQHIFYGQGDLKGHCNGDSGGPALVQVNGAPRVAGVMSYGYDSCRLLGAAVRVSSVSSFVQGFIDRAAPADAAVPADAPGSPDAAMAGDVAPPPDATDAVLPGDRPRPPPACGLTDPRPACDACVAARCCLEAAVCAADPLCRGCGASPLATCQSFPPSATLTACLAKCEGDPCGVAGLAGLVDAGAADLGRPSADATATPDGGPAADAPLDRGDVDQGDARAGEAAIDDAGRGGSAADATPTGTDGGGGRPEVADASGGDRRHREDGGCGCAAAGTPASPAGALAMALALLLAIVAPSQRRRTSRTSAQGGHPLLSRPQ